MACETGCKKMQKLCCLLATLLWESNSLGQEPFATSESKHNIISMGSNCSSTEHEAAHSLHDCRQQGKLHQLQALMQTKSRQMAGCREASCLFRSLI